MRHRKLGKRRVLPQEARVPQLSIRHQPPIEHLKGNFIVRIGRRLTQFPDKGVALLGKHVDRLLTLRAMEQVRFECLTIRCG